MLALELQGVQQVGPSWLGDVLGTCHGQEPELKKQVYSFIQVGAIGATCACAASAAPVAGMSAA